MKNTQLILTTLITLMLMACNGNEDKADGYGNFEATEILISSETSGKIVSFAVEEGKTLQANTVVGVIDTLQLSLKRDQLLAAKNTVFSKSHNVLSQREVLKERLRVAQVDQIRIQNLIADNAGTQKQVDAINGQIDILLQQIKSVETQNAPIVNEAKSIEIQIRQIEDQLKKSIIKNPIKGTVLVKYSEPHEITAFGKPLYKIADLEEMTLRVYLGESQLTSIKIGQQVIVKVDSGEELKSYSGKISWISDTAEFTPKIIQTKEERVNLVYATKILVKNDGGLKIGMPAEMWLSKTE